MAKRTVINATRAQQYDSIYAGLPKLLSPEYVELLRTATEEALPAPVLVRAYRELLNSREPDGGPCHAADATLRRLLYTERKYGYLRVLRKWAEKMLQHSDYFSLEDLIQNAKGEVVLKLEQPEGAGAVYAWGNFQYQRVVDACRELRGRRDERKPPPRAEAIRDEETGMLLDPVDQVTGESAPWHGRVGPDKLPWLEAFIRRTFATIAHDGIRAVGMNLLAENPLPLSSIKPGVDTLERKLGVDRFTLMRWRDDALAKLFAALRVQNECDIDTDFITFNDHGA